MRSHTQGSPSLRLPPSAFGTFPRKRGKGTLEEPMWPSLGLAPIRLTRSVLSLAHRASSAVRRRSRRQQSAPSPQAGKGTRKELLARILHPQAGEEMLEERAARQVRPAGRG